MNNNFIPADHPPDGFCKPNHKKFKGFVPASDSASAGAFGASGAPGIKNGNPKFIPAEALTNGDSFKNDVKYVPAYLQGREHSLNWWSPDAFFQYDSMLVSTYYGIKTPNYRDFYKIPRKGFTLYGDSGGFQNATVEGANLNPVNVLRWQEENCDIGFILDYPIAPSAPDNLIEIYRKRTTENAELALSKHQNKEMKLYGVLHGRNKEELHTMSKQYQDLSRFDGIALGSIVPKKSDYMYIAYISMLFAEEIQDYKKLPVHFFGVSGVNSLPIILYIAHKYDLNITFDSASYGVGAQHREYWNPFNLSKNSLTYGNDPKTSIVPSTLPCDCPVCSTIKNDLIDMIKSNKNNSVVGSLICLHNLYCFIRFSNMITAYSEKEQLLKDLVKNICVDTTSKALEFIDFSLENGIENGYKRYFEPTNPSILNETSSLFED